MNALRDIFGPHDGTCSLYVAGFLFREGGAEVALVEKQKPVWQAGMLNGIGGKVEIGETPEAAMQREFQEETGAKVSNWRRVCHLRGGSWSVVFFASDDPAEIQTMEKEEIEWWPVADLDRCETIPNLRWLIPLALDPGEVVATVIDSTP